MHFAQAFEQNLRAFLYTMDYHGWIEEIPLTDEQRRRFKDFDGFIDKSTCGLLLEKLRATSSIKNRRAWKAFDRALHPPKSSGPHLSHGARFSS
jgi:hypothetical protein